jgi:acyl-CoA synthetase (AMP-forming)/AMP-acid ligase II
MPSTNPPHGLSFDPAVDLVPRFDRLHRCVEMQAALRPDAPALRAPEAAFTYRELDAAAACTAARLAGLGLHGGDRLLIVAENGALAGVALLAASRLSAWAVIVNARASPREIDEFAAHSGARLLLFAASSPAAVEHARARGAQPIRLASGVDAWLAANPQAAPPEAVHDEAASQCAAMIYTSGTSGRPKAVMLSHANLLFIPANAQRMGRARPADVIYGVLPVSHVYGLSAIVLAAWLAGATAVLVPRFDPAALAVSLRDDGITVLHGAPAMYVRLLDWADAGGVPLAAPALRVVQSGGAPLTPEIKSRFEKALGLPLQNGYGMTEASPSIAQTRLDAPRADCSVGFPIPGQRVRLVRKDGSVAARGDVGEIRIQGPNVMLGYYRDGAATRAAFDADGWLCTGDLARELSDGALEIVGRAKEVIIRSGFNVYPVEIEDLINTHRAVAQSAVVGRAVAGNEEVIAFVEARPGATIDARELLAWLKPQLALYKLPAHVIVLPALPAFASGKIRKAELAQMAKTAGGS